MEGDRTKFIKFLYDITLPVVLIGAVCYGCAKMEEGKKYVRNHLESDAPWMGFRNDINYKDTDSNGLSETWIRDPKTGKEYKIVIQR